jgi:NAD(P)-dependent dehydrogenase (short-subunit alcohol dehydrogenase family)
MTADGLAGKRMLVTGASSGIGAAIAAELAAQGAAVAVVGRDAQRLAVTATVARERGAQCLEILADVDDLAELAMIVKQSVNKMGGLDGIVHAAGTFEVGPIADGVSALERQWRTNVRGPYALTGAALKHMPTGSAILFISSTAGHVGFPESSAYSASKGAIEALVRALAVELAPRGIRVNAISPGTIRTAMNARFFEDPNYLSDQLAITPLGRVGEVRDIAPAAAFLVSDDASYITGQSIVIDGGVVAS